jgi:membrane-associated protease RseP (regulator of RpoE activity)
MHAKLRDSLEWVLLVVVVFGGGAIAQAQNEQPQTGQSQNGAAIDQAGPTADQPPGKIVRIGPAGGSQITIDPSALDGESVDETQQPELPKHWIGILGGPVSDELRAQIEIPADQGVLVRQVVPGSPAEKAGLKAFDVLLKANDTNLSDVRDLTNLVRREGESGGKITLDVLRRGAHQSITLTPEARPEDAGFGGDAFAGPGPGMQAWHLGPRDPLSFGFRNLAPGMRLSPGFNLNQIPNGVSVSIQKQNDEPAHITVQRGNDTWTIVGDDPASLAQLPEDLRPFVEKLLQSPGQVQMSMPGMPGMMGSPGAFSGGGMQERLHRMEQQMEEMQQRMQMQFDQNPSDEPVPPDAN